MKTRFLAGMIVSGMFVVMMGLAGCANKADEAQAGKKVADLEKQLEEAKKEEAKAASSAKGGLQPKRAREFVVPAGTTIRVRTTNALTTKTAATGDSFEASLMEPLTMEGVTLAQAGASVTGVVLSSDSGGRVKDRAEIRIGLRSIQTSQGPVAIQSSSYGVVARGTVKRDVVRGGVMTGVGAAIGAIAGGGKGAAIGAGAGGAAGVGTAMATKGAPAEIPAETAVTFRLRTPMTVTNRD